MVTTTKQKSHPSQRRYTPELRERATRMVAETMAETGEHYGVIGRVARQLGIGTETLRNWVRQDEVATGKREAPLEESHRVSELEKELRELKRANEILIAAASFFGAELDRRHKR
ncbi:MAG: transposase [Acidimicrobiales bacterium]